MEYCVSDAVVFERWLRTYAFGPDERPNLRLGNVQEIVPYACDDPGPEMGRRFAGAIGIKIIVNPHTQTRTYKIVDEALFARFIEPDGYSVCNLPPIGTVRCRLGIYFNDWTNVEFANNGITLFDSDARDHRYYTVSNEQVSPLRAGISPTSDISGVVDSRCIESRLLLDYVSTPIKLLIYTTLDNADSVRIAFPRLP